MKMETTIVAPYDGTVSSVYAQVNTQVEAGAPLVALQAPTGQTESREPSGEAAEFAGLAAESPYIRGLLDILGAKPDFLTCGKFKSAAETYTRRDMSSEDRQESEAYLQAGGLEAQAAGKADRLDVQALRRQAAAWTIPVLAALSAR